MKTYKEYIKENNRELDPYGEEDWNDENTHVLELYNWLKEQFVWDFGFDLLYTNEYKMIELLKEEGEDVGIEEEEIVLTLVEDPKFYFCFMGDENPDGKCSLSVRYMYKRTRAKEKQLHDWETFNITIKDRDIIYMKLKAVIDSIKEDFSEYMQRFI